MWANKKKQKKNITYTKMLFSWKLCVRIFDEIISFRWGFQKLTQAKFYTIKTPYDATKDLAQKIQTKMSTQKTALKSTDTANTQESHLFHWQHTFILFRYFFCCFVFEKKKNRISAFP